MFKKARSCPNLLRGGLKEGYRQDLAVRPGVTTAAKKKRGRGQGQVHGGHVGHLQGPAQGQHRQRVIPTGKEYKQTDKELEKMDYLVEGVNGKLD